ncbi:MAG: DUF814 domain-containing protein [Chitinispirillaceae bacterium]|nr:DUF814 domain-containing protein [Chitinispirillaceae bacterium]
MMDGTVDSPEESVLLLQKPLVRLLNRLRKKMVKQEEELRETGKAYWYRQMADSLLAYPEQSHRGAVSARINNIHTRQDETVSLNPKFDRRGNAGLLYKKARKAERGGNINAAKVAETAALIESVEQMLRSCEVFLSSVARGNGADCRVLCGRVEELLRKHAPEMLPHGHPASGTVEARCPYRQFSTGAWSLFVGKNDSQNDELTTRFARHNDLWLHVAGHAGSHVVVRKPDKTSPVPPEILEKAAALAVWFSKAKHTSYAEVHYTEARFVHKRRHSPPGEVVLDRFKTMRVTPRSPQELFPSRYDRE